MITAYISKYLNQELWKLYNFHYSEGCAEECALDTENILGDTCSGWEFSLNKLKLFLIGISDLIFYIFHCYSSTCICAGMARHAGTACDAKNADRCSM